MKRIALLLFVVAACGKSDKDKLPGEGKVASCYMESMHGCVEYRDANLALGTESLQKLCTTVIKTAVFAETPCPTSNVIATCKRNEGKDFYYAGSEQRDVLEKQCTERGGTYGTK
jgi:hypothetical protein